MIFNRILTLPLEENNSIFPLGPRSTGKTSSYSKDSTRLYSEHAILYALLPAAVGHMNSFGHLHKFKL